MNSLIVDDHPADLRLLRAQLEAEGPVITEVIDGVQTLKILERTIIDAIISHALMPSLDGSRLCGEIRKRTRFHGGGDKRA